MQIDFYFDQTRCTGCCTCVVACKDWYGIPAGPSSWIEVTSSEDGVYPHVSLSHMFNACWHCARTLVCHGVPGRVPSPRGRRTASRRSTATRASAASNVGFACLKACPYKVPQFGAEPNPKMQKCGFCVERWSEGKKPICVEACPMRALDAGPEDELTSQVREPSEGGGLRLCCAD